MPPLRSLSKALLIAASVCATAADPKVVSLPLYYSSEGGPFYVNVTIGTPPQPFTMLLDTGSSDIWVHGVQACKQSNCSRPYYANLSSTNHFIPKSVMMFGYASGGGVDGHFMTETMGFGNGVEIHNQTIGWAEDATDDKFGVFGLGYPEGGTSIGGVSQPNAVYTMAEAGLIKSRTFSIWLDDLESNTGTVLFGGYDPAHYIGDLAVLPVLSNPSNDDQEWLDFFHVELSMLAITDGYGNTTALHRDQYPVPVLIDLGATFTYLLPDTVRELAKFVGAYRNTTQDNYVVKCDVARWNGSIDFGFGDGPNGTIIQVPFSELVIRDITFLDDEGTVWCQLGIDDNLADQSAPILGATFMRLAYIIHSFDANQTAIAQSAFHSKDSMNPIEIGPGGDLAALIPGARNDTTATMREAEYYTSLQDLLRSKAMTISVNGLKTTLSVVALPTVTHRTSASSTMKTVKVQQTSTATPTAA